MGRFREEGEGRGKLFLLFASQNPPILGKLKNIIKKWFWRDVGGFLEIPQKPSPFLKITNKGRAFWKSLSSLSELNSYSMDFGSVVNLKKMNMLLFIYKITP